MSWKGVKPEFGTEDEPVTHLAYLHFTDALFMILVVLAIWGFLLFLLIAFVRFLIRLRREGIKDDDD